MNIDIELGECYLAEFEKLSHRSKALLFSCFFNTDTDFDKESIINSFTSDGFNYDYCESPIEELFAVAYNIMLALLGFPYTEAFYLRSQTEIIANGNTYYADFLVQAKSDDWFHCDRDFKLVIECDGHDFHEKTKEQVERRNKRDLDIKSAGYDIIHFSGSQIYKDPMECANSVVVYMFKNTGKVRFGNGNL